MKASPEHDGQPLISALGSMGSGASSPEKAPRGLEAPAFGEPEPVAPRLASLALRHCDLHAASGGGRVDDEAAARSRRAAPAVVEAAAATPLAGRGPDSDSDGGGDGAGWDSDGVGPSAAERRELAAWGEDALLMGAAGRALTRLDLTTSRTTSRTGAAGRRSWRTYGPRTTRARGLPRSVSAPFFPSGGKGPPRFRQARSGASRAGAGTAAA